MEDSSSKPTAEEESGWTAYFDDFIAQQQADDDHNSDTCISYTPSLVSDAASTVPWKKNHNHPIEVISSPTNDQSTVLVTHKKLSFKKTRAKEISYHDDSLEDTASSPVNSPKLGSLQQVNINPEKEEDNYDFSMRGSDAFDISSGIQTKETIQMNTDIKYSELKNKGLCLVPLSMLDNYIG